MLATSEPVRVARSLEAAGLPVAPEWAAAAVVVTFCAVGTAVIAAGYATRPTARLGAWIVPVASAIVAWLVLACLVAIWLTLAGYESDEGLSPSSLLTRAATLPIDRWVLVILGLAALGVAGDLLPAVRRTRTRRIGGDGRPGPLGFAEVLADEVFERASARREAIAAERTRLASDLHAEVLPAVRRALADLETGASSAAVAVGLREVADRLDAVVRDRRDVVLEQLGLVPALEALAERVEGRTGVTVELAVEGSDRESARDGRPPQAVEAAAYRIAKLAVDNAVIHGKPTRIDVRAEAGPTAVAVRVADDGRSITSDDEARARRDGRQGIAEMRRLTAESSGRLELEAGEDGGTVVSYRWTA
jgi:signal transduction histidine kinase